ncbi:MAG: hypothetical protein KDC92_11120 [Bacteroidetes bacterium]|nr:hypothetical protein [Bacteroidota bacterium]
MKRVKLFIFTILLVSSSAFAQDNFTLNGYVKYMQTNFLVSTPSTTLLTDNLIHNRLNAKWYASDKLQFSVELRNRAFYGEYTKSIPNYGDLLDNDPGFVDMAFTWVNEPSFILHTMIDRANFTYQSKKWNLRVGRQRINWGINTVWTPNDVFNALNYLDFDYEERPGSDAVKFQYYLGDFSNLEVAFSPADSIEGSIAAIKYGTNYKGYDYQIMGGYYKQDLVLGAGWAGNIKSAGFKGEASYFTHQNAVFDSFGNLSATASIDYTFKKGWYGGVSFLYTSGGTTKSLAGNSALQLLGNNLSAKQLMPTRYTFFLMASKSLTAASSLNLSGMYAPGTNFFLLFPAITYSINNQFDLDFVAQASFIEMAQKLQHGGSGVFARLKWSF